MPEANQLLNQLYTQFYQGLVGFVKTDLGLLLTSMVTIMLILVGFVHIKQFLGMSAEAKDAKGAWGRWQANKGTWRESYLKEEFEEKMFTYKLSEFEKRRPDNFEDEESSSRLVWSSKTEEEERTLFK